MNRALIITAAALCVTLAACSSKEPPPATDVPTVGSPADMVPPGTDDLNASSTGQDPFGGNGGDPFGGDPPADDNDPFAKTASQAENAAQPAADGEDVSDEDSTSATDVFESVGRVINKTLGTEEGEEKSKGSIFGSIGRALTKGAQEAATAKDEDADE